MKLDAVSSNLQYRLSSNQIKWLCWIHCMADECHIVRVLSKRTMLTGVFFVLLRVVFFYVYPPVPVFIIIVFPKSLWAYGFALGGDCVRQGASGGHPRVSYSDMDLGVYRMLRPCCWETLPTAGSLVSLLGLPKNLCISYFVSTKVAGFLEWYSYILASS